ncbi:hypothetical protein [Streptomyces sp. NBC_01546]|uniref:ATP-dependent DNA ligase n=1 Tax=Streptomyces sp. NBC_01546 TaxID=2975872 RepID=UPI00386FE060
MTSSSQAPPFGPFKDKSRADSALLLSMGDVQEARETSRAPQQGSGRGQCGSHPEHMWCDQGGRELLPPGQWHLSTTAGQAQSERSLGGTAAEQLPHGPVLDGELVVWDTEAGRLPFEALQRWAATRARGARALAARWPAYFVAFDLLQQDGQELLRRPRDAPASPTSTVNSSPTTRPSPTRWSAPTSPPSAGLRPASRPGLRRCAR